VASTAAWLSLADRLYAKGVDIFDHSDLVESDAGTQDPKVVALTLLARTLGNFQAAVQLLGSKHVVEARTLARCCYENLYWITSLANKGDEFVKAMELDDAASRMKRANELLAWSKAQNQAYDFAERLEVFHKGLKEKHGKPGAIVHRQAADDGGVGSSYIVYRELSADAAHPSATSLSRHVTWSDEGDASRFSVHAVPEQEYREVEDTLELLCSAVLGVCVGANEIVGGAQAGERLDALSAEFRKLSDGNKAAREKHS
jgi:hypothetical protein